MVHVIEGGSRWFVCGQGHCNREGAGLEGQCVEFLFAFVTWRIKSGEIFEFIDKRVVDIIFALKIFIVEIFIYITLNLIQFHYLLW